MFRSSAFKLAPHRVDEVSVVLETIKVTTPTHDFTLCTSSPPALLRHTQAEAKAKKEKANVAKVAPKGESAMYCILHSGIVLNFVVSLFPYAWIAGTFGKYTSLLANTSKAKKEKNKAISKKNEDFGQVAAIFFLFLISSAKLNVLYVCQGFLHGQIRRLFNGL